MGKYGRTTAKKSSGLSNHSQRMDAQEKIALIISDMGKLFQAHNGLAQDTQSNMDAINNRLNDISVVIQAMATIVGTDKVNDEARKIRIEMSEKGIVATDANIAKAVTDGSLKVTDTVTETCLLVVTATKPDGTQKYPRKSYLEFGGMAPELQAIAKDKKAGDSFEAPNGAGTITILEVYENVVKNI
jgi:hypothetical protein